MTEGGPYFVINFTNEYSNGGETSSIQPLLGFQQFYASSSSLFVAGVWCFRCAKGCRELPYLSPWIEHFRCTDGQLLHLLIYYFSI